jgi:A/G-specific adenine glycosylase
MPPSIQQRLLRWYDAERRDLPWRRTRDPYAIWVSEIMLQQTQVASVIPYYERWMTRFPDVETLAKADIQEVLSVWQGLGYYRRCRHLHAGAAQVSANGLPKTCAEWKEVPGIGRYTAAAISSIAFGEATALVDGNVERVYSRLTGDSSVGERLHNAAWKWAAEAVLPDRPGDWNQALMELGACICKPANPICAGCPLRTECVARKQGVQGELPKRVAKPQEIKLDEIVWIPYYRGEFGVQQIPKGEWWHGMWEFPRTTSEGANSTLLLRVGAGRLEHAGALTYHVTHHRIRLAAFVHHGNRKSKSLRWLSGPELASLPMPSPQRKALKLAMARLAAPVLVSEKAGSR